jgi:hypothetical protein
MASRCGAPAKRKRIAVPIEIRLQPLVDNLREV